MRIYLSRPHMSGREEQLISEVFAENFVAPVGRHLDAFESVVENYLGGGVYCVAVSSGSAALHLALRIAGVGFGDEVWVSSMTFAGGVFPITYLGAKPRFFDVSSETWTIDTDLLADALAKSARNNNLPKAILPTDLYGQSVDLSILENLALQYGVKLIVDSAESLGAAYLNGRKTGTGGDAAILSFNGNKVITASTGGMFVTRHKAWAEEARFLATQARDNAPHYEHTTYGYNYRLSNVCAAIGLAQMEVLDNRVNRRREIFGRYKDKLSYEGVEFMPEPLGFYSSRWLTTLTVDSNITGVSREDVRLMLLEKSIESRPLWKPMHLQPFYKNAPYTGSHLDEKLFAGGLCLPSGSDMTDDQQDEIIELISRYLKS